MTNKQFNQYRIKNITDTKRDNISTLSRSSLIHVIVIKYGLHIEFYLENY